MRSLWLIPDQKAYREIAQVIERLSSRHKSPSFEPHVTLLSGIIEDGQEAFDKAAAFAEALASIEAGLVSIDFLETYYRCLFFRTDESQALLAARKEAEELFTHTQIEPFIPHISFLYGSLPIFAKEAIISELGGAYPKKICLTRLRLVDTGLRPEQWRNLGEWPL